MSGQTGRFAVIGSNSFSGAHLIDLLLSDPGGSVIGISRSPEYPPCLLAYARRASDRFRFHQLDLNRDHARVMDTLDAFEPGYVVNFAAQGEVRSSFDHPDHHYRTNALANVQLVEALRKRGYLKRYLQISTPEVYGSSKQPLREDARFDPSSPYAASKGSLDLFINAMVKTFGFPAVTVRATNVYGPYQQLYRIIPRTVITIKNGGKINLQGGGVAVKSYIHIGDVSRGELAVLLNGSVGGVYHLSPDGGGISVRSVVETVCTLMNVPFNRHVNVVEERLGQDAAYVLDSSKARAELGWRPEIDFQEGVRQVVQWIERDWEAIRALPLDYIHKP